ncbi:MAG TPA: hypothetical protein V6D27_10835 [Vampirovibrionales bacterium]
MSNKSKPKIVGSGSLRIRCRWGRGEATGSTGDRIQHFQSVGTDSYPSRRFPSHPISASSNSLRISPQLRSPPSFPQSANFGSLGIRRQCFPLTVIADSYVILDCGTVGLCRRYCIGCHIICHR